MGEQTYRGMLLGVQRRSARGISVDANYTLSKCEGHPTQGGTTPNVNSGYVNPYDIDYDYGACTADRRHVFNLTGGYQTPEFDGRLLRAIGSNWRVSMIYRVSSGSPLTVTVTGDPAGTGIGGQRANLEWRSVWRSGLDLELSELRVLFRSGGRRIWPPAARRRLRSRHAQRRYLARQSVSPRHAPNRGAR